MSSPLTSWTRTLNEEEAALLLDEARPGERVDEWSERAHDLLPQAGRDRRTELIRLVREQLLDVDGDEIAESAYLRLFHEGTPGRRDTLLHGRFLLRNPWIDRALSGLVYPQLAAADEPLAARDAALIPDGAWDAFFAQHLVPGTGPESVRKTRSTVMRNLARLGVLEISGNTTREARVRRGQPDPVGFSWVLGHELRQAARTEADFGWVLRDSRTRYLFAAPEAYVERCVDEGVAAGLFRRGFLAGQPRLHLEAA